MGESLVQTSVWGVDSHGVLRLTHYLRRMTIGSVKAAATPVVMRTGPVTAQIHGEDGLGIVHATLAHGNRDRDGEGERRGRGGRGRTRRHCGAMGLYTRMAAREHLVGIAMTHSSLGGRSPRRQAEVLRHQPDLVRLRARGRRADLPRHGDLAGRVEQGAERAHRRHAPSIRASRSTATASPPPIPHKAEAADSPRRPDLRLQGLRPRLRDRPAVRRHERHDLRAPHQQHVRGARKPAQDRPPADRDRSRAASPAARRSKRRSTRSSRDLRTQGDILYPGRARADRGEASAASKASPSTPRRSRT